MLNYMYIIFTEFEWRGFNLEASIPSFCQGQGKLTGADQASSGGDQQAETENQGKAKVPIAGVSVDTGRIQILHILCVDTDRKKTNTDIIKILYSLCLPVVFHAISSICLLFCTSRVFSFVSTFFLMLPKHYLKFISSCLIVYIQFTWICIVLYSRFWH